MPHGYNTYWNEAEKPGYSGTALFTKTPPISIKTGILGNEFDPEGRTQIIEYQDFIVINCYFPNGNVSTERLNFKLSFYSKFIDALKNKVKPVIVCADVNTAHKSIDLANPSAARGRSGFLDEERTWLDALLKQGFIDTLRDANPETKGLYTWWAMRQGIKERNSGWRFDYIYADKTIENNIAEAFTEPEVNISDHCPIGIKIEGLRINETEEKVLPKSQQASMF